MDKKIAENLVKAYGGAVSNRTFWRDHGRRGDGKLEDATRKEDAARRDLLAYMRKLERENAALKECHAASA